MAWDRATLEEVRSKLMEIPNAEMYEEEGMSDGGKEALVEAVLTVDKMLEEV